MSKEGSQDSVVLGASILNNDESSNHVTSNQSRAETISNTPSTELGGVGEDAHNKFNVNNDDPNIDGKNQPFSLFKSQLSDMNLFNQLKRIQESAHEPHVADALLRLDSYREQITNVVTSANNWAKSLNTSLICQKQLLLRMKELKFEPVEQNLAEQQEHFFILCKGLNDELSTCGKQYQQKMIKSQNLLMEPLKKLLNTDILHAIEMRKKYLKNKKRYDYCCNILSKIQKQMDIYAQKLKSQTSSAEINDDVENLEEHSPIIDASTVSVSEDLNEPPPPQVDPMPIKSQSTILLLMRQDSITMNSKKTSTKLKNFFQKIATKTDSVDDLKIKEKIAREEVRIAMKNFKQSKMHFMEAIGKVDTKFSVEIVYRL